MGLNGFNYFIQEIKKNPEVCNVICHNVTTNQKKAVFKKIPLETAQGFMFAFTLGWLDYSHLLKSKSKTKSPTKPRKSKPKNKHATNENINKDSSNGMA